MHFLTLVDEYIEVCEYNQSPPWVDRKRNLLNTIATWNHFPKELEAVNPGHLVNWLVRRKQEGASPRTLNQELAILKSTFGYAVSMDYIQKNPAKLLKRFAVEDTEPEIYTMDEINRMLKTAEGDDHEYLLVLKLTLARVNEINKLKWDDVDFENGLVWLGKAESATKPRRSLPMNDQLKFLLQDRKVSCMGSTNSSYVFGYTDKRRMLKSLCSALEIEYKGFHAIRRGVATHLVDKDVHVKNIADILGHKSLTHTRRYLRRSDDRIRNVLNDL